MDPWGKVWDSLDRSLCAVVHHTCTVTEDGTLWVGEQVGETRLPEYMQLDYDPIWGALIALSPWWPYNEAYMIEGFDKTMSLLPPRPNNSQGELNDASYPGCVSDNVGSSQPHLQDGTNWCGDWLRSGSGEHDVGVGGNHSLRPDCFREDKVG